MVAFNDRREQNPFSLTTPGYEKHDEWADKDPAGARSEVFSHFGDQQNTQTWGELNRLAKQRTNYQMRKGYFSNGSELAEGHEANLARLISRKAGPLAEKFGEAAKPYVHPSDHYVRGGKTEFSKF